MVFEVKIRIKHECPFLEFSMLFGRKKIYHYAGSDFHYLLLPDPITKKVIEHGFSTFPNFEKWKISGNIVSLQKEKEETWKFTNRKVKSKKGNIPLNPSIYENSITTLVSLNGGMSLFPVIYENGYEYHSILCNDSKILTKVLNALKKLPETEILQRNDIGEDSLYRQSAIFFQMIGQLTEKQIAVSILAFNKGYYDIPRKIRLQDIAEELGVTRYAIERLLRASENKIMKFLIPYLNIKNIEEKTEDSLSERLQKISE